MKNKKAEAIPGAKHLEWGDLLDQETLRFKSPYKMRKLFGDPGITLDQPTAVHCQGGYLDAVLAVAPSTGYPIAR